MNLAYKAPDLELWQGDVGAGLPFADGSVHAVVTSPPYYGLRSYMSGADPLRSAEIGLEATVDCYLDRLVQVFRHVRRVLRDDGTLWLDLGDSYAGSGKGPTYFWDGIGDQERRQGFTGNRMELRHRQVMGRVDAKPPAGLKPKDLMEVPSRVVLALQADGWYLRSRLPWIKRNTMPESTRDRPTTAVEYVFLLGKGPTYFWDGMPVARASAYVGRLVKASGDGARNARDRGMDDAPGGAMRTSWGFTQHDTLVSPTRNLRNSDPFFDSLDLSIAEQRAYLAHLEHVREHGGLLLSEDGEPLALDICPEPSAYDYCEACNTLWQGPGRRHVRQVRRDGKVMRQCPCGVTDGWVAHFAAFPSRLVETCLLASTSERGVCPECGSPWQRRVERREAMVVRPRAFAKSGNEDQQDTGRIYREMAGHTLGWQPSCRCDAGEPVSATVLDPFAGSGTTLQVARRLGRRGLGVDLSPRYVKLAQARLETEPPTLLPALGAGLEAARV